jgi:hypothetical protein
MDDIETIKMLVGQPTANSDLVQFYLDESIDYIKGYCNINAIPLSLHRILLQIAALLYASNTSDGKGSAGGGGGSGAIASISDGNQSVSFSTGVGSIAIVCADEIQTKFSSILDKFRVMKGAEGNRYGFRRC